MDLPQRLLAHHEGRGASYTRTRRPVELVWSEFYESVAEAFFVEKRIQGWRRAKREALIRGDFHLLPGLSHGRTPSRRDLVSTGSTTVAEVSTARTDVGFDRLNQR